MNLFDKAIMAFAPGWGASRMKARADMLASETAMTQLGRLRSRMAYDGATAGRRAAGWRVVSTDANSENLPALGRLRDVARDMVRNNPHAARAKKLFTDNIVGTGIIPTASARNKTRKARLEKLLKQHVDTVAIDARGQVNLYGLQQQMIAAIAESGEVLVRRRWRKLSDGLPLPFQLEVIEADYLDSGKNEITVKDGVAVGRIVQGVEFDAIGRRVGYWLFPSHPGDRYGMVTMTSRRIDASEIAHIYRIDRPGQVRGITWFSPVILKLRDLADAMDAELVRRKIAACFAAFVTSEEESGDSPRSDTGGTYQAESFEPGMIQRLKEGEEVTLATPPTVGDYEAAVRVDLRTIAVGLGIPYEILAGDLSGVNFSSGRMGWLEFQRLVSGAQMLMLAPMGLERIGGWFLEAAWQMIGPDAEDAIGWTPPRREMINPKEEVAALRDAIRAGFLTRSWVVRTYGFDPEDLEGETAEDNRRADDKGLVFDSDPRQRTAAGNAVTAGASANDPSAAQDTSTDPNNPDTGGGNAA